ncbi:hypothetical protein [Sphingopyxis sp. RIFCSPHIGHO2_12_FULL_65_19]|uniref:hypothetical protein n=1 Tax=Sphingopyxis sp. RIFCSPHIGHO2_12_FULL_65_19 TaxID=1802172 RepID=UPI0008B8CCD2|nr:hypothetical protein [Sphingopyxis sp. RIFCSPHIGHO2_12_FULL_65_19]OHD09714.1 MAG: hypothetical protein A3E77_08940 [Sphingopyxis sp. RIFCSPHIGHO2_12_FULL_65_19]
MTESVSSPGIDPPSPTLSARLRELADYLAAPTAGRLTEEQRALSLGIARRLVVDLAARLDPEIDPAALWAEWLRGGLPCASRLAGICFARAEEHRWREQSAQRTSPPPLLSEPDASSIETPTIGETPSEVERAYLTLQIADRRRFDSLGNPSLAAPDIDEEVFRALLLDIAAWRLAEVSQDRARASKLGDAVRVATEQQTREMGITRAGVAFYNALGATLPDAAAGAIGRHDWPTLIALAAACHRRDYDDMALALLTAETAALPSLLAPLRLDHAALAPLEASLAMLPARAVGGADYGDARLAERGQ